MTKPALQLCIERGFRLPVPRRDVAPSRLRLALVRVRPRRPQVVTHTAATTIRQQIRLVLAPRYELARHLHEAPLAPPEVREAEAVRHEVERLVERIVTRTTRVEAPARPAPARTATRSGHRQVPPAAAAVASLARSTEQTPRPAASAFPRLAPPRPPAAAAHPPAAPAGRSAEPHAASPSARVARPEPPLDVARITDRVLETLDRRLIAQRERRGRI